MPCLSTFVPVLVACATLLFPAALPWQEPGPQVTIRKQVDLVMLDLLLTDAKGGSLTGLRAKDIQLLDEMTPQEIAHFSQDEIPLAIAILVDISGSMRPGMQPLRKGLIQALPTLKPDDRVALFSFDQGAKLRVKLTHDFAQIAKKVTGFKAGGWTNINDAIYKAAEYLREDAPHARRVVLLISDTFPSENGKKPAGDELLASEAALFVIRVPFWIDNKYFTKEDFEPLTSQGLFAALGQSLVDQLASASGGVVLDVKRPEGIEAAIEKTIQILKTRYTLGFYPNPPGKPGSIRKIELRLKTGDIVRAMPGAILGYRNRYRVPPLETPKPPR